MPECKRRPVNERASRVEWTGSDGDFVEAAVLFPAHVQCFGDFLMHFKAHALEFLGRAGDQFQCQLPGFQAATFGFIFKAHKICC